MTVCNIAFAGGQCMSTMIRAGEQLSDLCAREGISIKIQYVDLWTSDYLMPGVRLVIEMYPYYRNLNIPVVSGKAFLARQGEEALLAQIVDLVREISSR
jgi:hypothetical protein